MIDVKHKKVLRIESNHGSKQFVTQEEGLEILEAQLCQEIFTPNDPFECFDLPPSPGAGCHRN